MRLFSVARLATLPALASVILMLALPVPAWGHSSGISHRSSFFYSSPANVLRGQLALEKEGHLERGRYEPGRYDPPTREAIRDFQRRHKLRSSGRLDRDTFAVLPIDGRPDGDDDGVPDAGDRCPETKRGTRSGYDGCPVPDGN